jgi:hypothetical protein
MLKKIKFILILSFSFFGGLHAQQNDNNPYSRFGIGDLTDNNFNHLRQMGGLGASFIDAYHINIVNPASLAYLNATAFDVGVFAKRSILDDGKNIGKVWSGNLDYLSLAFPLRNPINEIYDGVKKDYKLGMALTLMPHSTVDYNIAYQDSVAVGQPFTRNYTGGGGSYKVMWGNAIKYKKVSIGVNLGYLFGSLRYENKLIFDDSEFAYSDFYANDYNVRGFLWNTGFMYSDVLNKKQILANKTTPSKRISIGAHFNSGTSFSTSSNINHLLIQQITSNLINFDTVNIASEVAGKGKLPAELGVGATYYYGEKFAIGLNYTAANWSEYFNDAARESKGTLSNTSKWSLGGFLRPDYKSFDNFFKRVYYRYGAYYNTDPRVIDGKSIDTYGLTFGLGMPFVFQRKISHVNLGVNAGIRGQNSPISEKFVKFTLGVTFNDDEWFLKRKYN